MTKKAAQESKILMGLKEAVEAAEKRPVYDRIADRVMKAIEELNGALKEAHECPEMCVFIGATQRSADNPMQFTPQVYRLTHSTMVFTVKYEKPEWQVIKDPSIEDAAGRGLNALNKKKAA